MHPEKHYKCSLERGTARGKIQIFFKKIFFLLFLNTL